MELFSNVKWENCPEFAFFVISCIPNVILLTKKGLCSFFLYIYRVDSSHFEAIISSTQHKKQHLWQGHMTHTDFTTSTLFLPMLNSLFSRYSHLVDVAQSNPKSLTGSQHYVRSTSHILNGGNTVRSTKNVLDGGNGTGMLKILFFNIY